MPKLAKQKARRTGLGGVMELETNPLAGETLLCLADVDEIGPEGAWLHAHVGIL